MKHLSFFLILFSVAMATNAQPRPILGVVPGYGDAKLQSSAMDKSVPARPMDWMSKFDAHGLWLHNEQQSRNKSLTTRDWIDVFVKLDGDVDLSDLGYVERSRAGDISVGRIPKQSVRALASDARVRYVETSRVSRRLNATGKADTGVNRVHAGDELPEAIKGQGVVVGVLDSGIDFTHADFSGTNGTRIQFIMDMRSDDTEVIYTKAQIDANPGAVAQRDGNGSGGHGTHVTGTAAGANGVAPESDIIFVKGIRDDASNGGFSDADIANGTAFIFAKAEEMGRPAVVNLSLGGNYGPLDGTSAQEQFLSNLTGPGKLIVAAAGNEGSDYIHAGVNLQPNVLYESLIEPISSEFNVIEMWYEAGSMLDVAFGVYTVDAGELVYLGKTASISMGNTVGVTQNGELDPIAIELDDEIIGYFAVESSNTVDAENGDGQAYLVLSNNDDPNVDLNFFYWTILYESTPSASGRVDMWVNGGGFYPEVVGLEDVEEIPGDRDFSVGSPATSRKVISVGSYVTRTNWTDIDGVNRNVLWQHPSGEGTIIPTVGTISEFSSRGPTRDGRLAPVIAAPGEKIASSLSSHLNVRATQNQAYEQGGVYRGDVVIGNTQQVMQGTSMASPHLAGVVALMLQVDPLLDYEKTVSILTETARTDEQVGVAPNVSYGNGKVDAHAAVSRALTLTSIEDYEHERGEGPALLGNYPNPFNPSTVVRFQLSIVGEVSVKVYDVLGREVAVLVNDRMLPGQHSVTFDAAGLPSGMYVVVLESNGFRDMRKVMLVK
jgi:subtilisin family serine protease